MDEAPQGPITHDNAALLQFSKQLAKCDMRFLGKSSYQPAPLIAQKPLLVAANLAHCDIARFAPLLRPADGRRGANRKLLRRRTGRPLSYCILGNTLAQIS